MAGGVHQITNLKPLTITDSAHISELKPPAKVLPPFPTSHLARIPRLRSQPKLRYRASQLRSTAGSRFCWKIQPSLIERALHKKMMYVTFLYFRDITAIRCFLQLDMRQDCLLREILCKSVSGYAPSASRGRNRQIFGESTWSPGYHNRIPWLTTEHELNRLLRVFNQPGIRCLAFDPQPIGF